MRVLSSANDGTLDPVMFVNICKSIELLQSTLLPLSRPAQEGTDVVGKVESGGLEQLSSMCHYLCHALLPSLPS